MSKSVRAGLTFNLKPADAAAHGDAFEEFDSIETIEALERALRANGHEPVRIGYGAALLDADVDFVFNIAEGFGGRGRESHVPAVCELLGIPCTGSDPLTIGITLDKALAKTYAKAHGIAVAGDWRFPLFVKPACEGSSMGITKSSLCRTPEELQAVVAQMSKYGAVLIEEFLPGEEYTVGIVQGEVLGVMQVVPRSQEPDFVYSIDVNRDYENLVDYKLVQADDVAQLALDVWREFGLRDVARIDVRRDRDGVPCFIEVNPLPGVHPKHSDLVIMARLAGVAYEELIGRIVARVIPSVVEGTGWAVGAPPVPPGPSTTLGMTVMCHAERSRGIPSGRSESRASAGDSSTVFAARNDTDAIAVAFNDDTHLKQHLNDIERIGEAESAESAREIAETLGATLYPVRDLRPALRDLRDAHVVFNLCEGVLGNPRYEMHFALALEMLGIPFTGADPIAAGLCTDKILVKRLLNVHGITTPRDDVFPAIVKPSREDAGVGIDAASVVKTKEEAEARKRYIEETYRQPALIEEFIDGREFNQAMSLDRMLPPGEIVFADELAPEERVVGWKAKWASGSREDRATVNVTPGVMSDTLRRDISDLCRKAADVLSIRGYCRMDIRQRPTGELCIVDINPNPDIGPDSGFRKALAAAGIGFRDFLEELMMSALSRNSRRTA